MSVESLLAEVGVTQAIGQNPADGISIPDTTFYLSESENIISNASIDSGTLIKSFRPDLWRTDLHPGHEIFILDRIEIHIVRHRTAWYQDSDLNFSLTGPSWRNPSWFTPDLPMERLEDLGGDWTLIDYANIWHDGNEGDPGAYYTVDPTTPSSWRVWPWHFEGLDSPSSSQANSRNVPAITAFNRCHWDNRYMTAQPNIPGQPGSSGQKFHERPVFDGELGVNLTPIVEGIGVPRSVQLQRMAPRDRWFELVFRWNIGATARLNESTVNFKWRRL